MTKYVDARELSDDYHREVCPRCGVKRWFKHLTRDRWPVDQYNCQSCGRYLHDDIEYPCPECGVRMRTVEMAFACLNQNCEHDRTPVDLRRLTDRLSSDSFMVRGMPGVMVGDCPACGAENAVNGGPDGELECSECPRFYAGQFSDAWYCYAIWLKEPDKIRVAVGGGDP